MHSRRNQEKACGQGTARVCLCDPVVSFKLNPPTPFPSKSLKSAQTFRRLCDDESNLGPKLLPQATVRRGLCVLKTADLRRSPKS